MDFCYFTKIVFLIISGLISDFVLKWPLLMELSQWTKKGFSYYEITTKEGVDMSWHLLKKKSWNALFNILVLVQQLLSKRTRALDLSLLQRTCFQAVLSTLHPCYCTIILTLASKCTIPCFHDVLLGIFVTSHLF